MKIPTIECKKIGDHTIYHSGYYGGYIIVNGAGFIVEETHWAVSGPMVFTSERLAEEHVNKELEA